MATMKIKKGDTVKVIAGKDINSEGKVIAVNRKNHTVLVEGVNMVTKHTKPSMANQQGGIVHQEGGHIEGQKLAVQIDGDGAAGGVGGDSLRRGGDRIGAAGLGGA